MVLVWIILRSLLLHQWKCMHTISLSLSNLLIECLYCLQHVPARWQRKEIKMKNNMYIEMYWSLWYELQLFYNLQKNALVLSVFACIIIYVTFLVTLKLWWTEIVTYYKCFYCFYLFSAVVFFFFNLLILLFSYFFYCIFTDSNDINLDGEWNYTYQKHKHYIMQIFRI